MTTIQTTFDTSVLPDWAKRESDVVWLCKRNHDFRCAVGSATSEDYQRFLAREARRRRTDLENN